MSRPKRTNTDEHAGVAIVASPSAAERKKLGAAIESIGLRRLDATTLDQARSALESDAPMIVLVRADMPDGCGSELTSQIRRRSNGTATILVEDSMSAETALSALRSGATDVIAMAAPKAEIVARVQGALQREAPARERAERMVRLKRVCQRLNVARRDMSEQISSLCTDLVDAYQELSDRMVRVTLASEFGSVIRQELDVENLLRAALEYLLAKIGPTNAAVFLPATTDEFSLGAYVNFDCPKDTAEMLFEHLADTIAPRMEQVDGVRSFEGADDICAYFGEEAHWLGDAVAVAFSCFSDDECLAVGLLFRDRRQPFDVETIELIETISGLFGRQLGRVIHLHHRHLPREQWGIHNESDEGYDDLDLAA
jgi:DNA-binding response OmpR family regulator